MAFASSLQDDFNDNTRDISKWDNTNGTGISEVNCQLETTTVLAGGEYWWISKDTFDFTGKAISQRIVDAGNQALASLIAYFCEIADAVKANFAYWSIHGNQIYTKSLGVQHTVDAYDANTFRYLKIRESGGNIYYDYSSDGERWINKYSEANPFVMTTVYQYVGDVSTGVEATATTCKCDSFNILPGGRPGNIPRSIKVGNGMSRNEGAT